MLLNSDPPTTSVLLIDGSDTARRYFADQLKQCSPAYSILEAADGQTGLDLYRSRRVDCVILALDLPDGSGFEVLVDLVSIASKPTIPVIVLTHSAQRGVKEIVMQNGAHAYLVKQFTSGADLNEAIQRGVAQVRPLPKEDRYRHSNLSPGNR